MKKVIITIAVLFILLLTGKSQTIDNFFEKYASDERFEYISINKGMINMVDLFSGKMRNDVKIMEKMNGLRILSLTADPNSAIMKHTVSEMEKIISNGKFESAVEVRDKGQKVNIYYRVINNKKSDMLIITREKNEFNCVWIDGKMTKEEMQNTFSNNPSKNLALKIS